MTFICDGCAKSHKVLQHVVLSLVDIKEDAHLKMLKSMEYRTNKDACQYWYRKFPVDKIKRPSPGMENPHTMFMERVYWNKTYMSTLNDQAPPEETVVEAEKEQKENATVLEQIPGLSAVADIGGQVAGGVTSLLQTMGDSAMTGALAMGVTLRVTLAGLKAELKGTPAKFGGNIPGQGVAGDFVLLDPLTGVTNEDGDSVQAHNAAELQGCVAICKQTSAV
jgi:hypothetical protein